MVTGPPDTDGCAVRFTGTPGTKDHITVLTMTHLLSSKGFHLRRSAVSQSHDAVYERASQNDKTKYFFSLPTSSVSRLLVTPTAKVKRAEFLTSDLKQGDIVAALWQCSDEGGGDISRPAAPLRIESP